MPDNHIAFAAEDPGVGVLGPDGKLKLFRGPDIANFSRARKRFAMTADASVVRYPLDSENRVVHSFSVFGGGDQNTEAPLPRAKSSLGRFSSRSASRSRTGMTVSARRSTAKCPSSKNTRCRAVMPLRRTVRPCFWARNGPLRLLRPDATEIWSVKLPAVVWSVNVSRNGLLAVAALSDGTIRWYRDAGRSGGAGLLPPQ